MQAFPGASWSPDGRLIIFTGESRNVWLCDSSGNLLRILEGHTDWVLSAAWSPDSCTFVSTGVDGTLLLWGADGTLLKTLEGHTDWVLSAAWSPDGRTIASTGADMTLRLWDSTGTLLQTLEGHSDWVRSAAWSPDGRTIVSTGDDLQMVWYGIQRTWDSTGTPNTVTSTAKSAGAASATRCYPGRVLPVSPSFPCLQVSARLGRKHPAPIVSNVVLVLVFVSIVGSLALPVIGALVRRTLPRPLGEGDTRIQKVVCSPWTAPAQAAGQTAVGVHRVQAATSDLAPTEVLVVEQTLRAHQHYPDYYGPLEAGIVHAPLPTCSSSARCSWC